MLQKENNVLKSSLDPNIISSFRHKKLFKSKNNLKMFRFKTFSEHWIIRVKVIRIERKCLIIMTRYYLDIPTPPDM